MNEHFVKIIFLARLFFSFLFFFFFEWIVGKEIMANTKKHCCYHILIFCLLQILLAQCPWIHSSKPFPASFSSPTCVLLLLCKNLCWGYSNLVTLPCCFFCCVSLFGFGEIWGTLGAGFLHCVMITSDLKAKNRIFAG